MAKKCVIGVDLGGTKVIAGAVDEDLNVLHHAYREVLGLPLEELIETVVDEVKEAWDSVDGQVEAVGFGIPALIDRESERAVSSVHLPLADVSFGEMMRERLGRPVAIDNDGNCAALAESVAGAGQGAKAMVFIGLGTGVASGLVIGGELYRGVLGAATEIGHMIVDMDGLPCHGNCPSRGCLETVASGTALVREAMAVAAAQPESSLGRILAEEGSLSGRNVTELAAGGDPLAVAAVEKIGRGLGVGVVNVANIFNPDVVVVGGGVIAAGDLLLNPAREVLRERALAPGAEFTQVKQAAFAEDAGMIGAAILARREAR